MRPFQYWNFPKKGPIEKMTFCPVIFMAFNEFWSDFQSDYVKRTALLRLIGFLLLWFHFLLLRPKDFFARETLDFHVPGKKSSSFNFDRTRNLSPPKWPPCDVWSRTVLTCLTFGLKRSAYFFAKRSKKTQKILDPEKDLLFGKAKRPVSHWIFVRIEIWARQNDRRVMIDLEPS